MTFNIILGIAALLGIVYVAGDAYYQYRTTPGNGFLTAFENSLTIAVARLSALAVLAWDEIAKIADIFNQPQIASALQTAVPDAIKPYIILGMLVLAEWARRRTLQSTTPSN